ncbi:MerR family transcriptional regulator [Phycicoccus sp. Soil748]|uniref:MerR family transcriptional regulator n=1 Tax=Phycicoccus sp. Soil748 TaxID=1736397 RepID=UPI000702E5CF|nr:MerR family transcriptional regulator [Phycicoccus sp. Soil748]
MPDDLVGAVEWSVGTVADRLGISAATLRTWDRRYGVGPSQRTEGGHRRYGEEDIHRVRVMARFTARGVPAQSAARVALSMDSERLTIETDSDRPQAGSPVRHGTVEAICSAALSLDAESLSRIYQRCLREHDLVTAWTEVFAPALRSMGDQWGGGSLGVECEHLASEVLATELRTVIRLNRPRTTDTFVVLACADEEQHHLPLLAVEAELARHGVAALGLGARVPTEALEHLLMARRPSRIFLWASIARQVDERLWQVLAAVGWPLDVVLGGPGWPVDLPAPARTVTVTRVHTLEGATETLLAAPTPGATVRT